MDVLDDVCTQNLSSFSTVLSGLRCQVDSPGLLDKRNGKMNDDLQQIKLWGTNKRVHALYTIFSD